MELKDKVDKASDDEEDLEFLRRAALQSLKPKQESIDQQPTVNNPPPFMKKKRFHSNGGRGFHNRRNFHNQGPPRHRNNGFGFNPRCVRNTNLISITPNDDTTSNETKKNDKVFEESSGSKLILPQDRYCKKNDNEEKNNEVADKFSRYDNSDDSDSDSDANDSDKASDKEIETSPKKLERSDSFEQLMQDLENEINGDAEKEIEEKKLDEEPEPSKIKSKPKKEIIENEKNDVVNSKEVTTEIKETNNVKKVDEKIVEVKTELPVKPIVDLKSHEETNKRPRRNSRSPEVRPNYRRHNKYYNNYDRIPEQNFSHPPPPYNQGPPPPPQNIPRFNQNLPYCNMPPNNYQPLRIDCPPLQGKPEIPISMAPLSPRSAAFVLQNREIIERRKIKSPRRSRSPSPFRTSPPPRYRDYSVSPKRTIRKSKSPPIRRYRSRSKSPQCRQRSPPPKMSRKSSPINKRSPQHSPLRKSPIRRKSPPSNRPCVKDRLGLQSSTSLLKPEPEEPVKKRSKTPEVIVEKTEEKKAIDPIIEARKRKFESTEIKPEGIIRLKQKALTLMEEEKNKDKAEEDQNQRSQSPELKLDEDELDILEDDILDDAIDTKVDDLFSDEDSNDETEGRFKTKLTHESKPVTVLPFSKLLNPGGNKSKVETLEPANGRVIHRRNVEEKGRLRHRSRSPLSNKFNEINRRHKHKRSKDSNELSVSNKNKTHRAERKEHVTSPIENKKIEIKIRNPAKYEAVSDDASEKNEGFTRRIEVAKSKTFENEEPEIIIDDDEVSESTSCNDGDLRAQLKRKRAERQQKVPILENNQSRILHNALKGAVFRKTKPSKDISSGRDGKLPIHMRLGVATSPDASERKRKTHKSKGSVDQV